MNLQFVKAVESDAKEITELLIRVYNDDIKRWNKTKIEGFIPGYDSEDMQKFHMRTGAYYKFMCEEKIAGIVVITNTGKYHDRIDFLYIDVDYQNKGIGTKMIKLIEEKFPNVTEWTLDTSQKSLRNHHFYEKLGYIKEDEDEDERYYKKIIEGEKSIKREENKDLSKIEYANCNMRECDFYSLNLRKSVFNNVSISESKISNTLIQNATISNMNMCRTLFGNGKMDECEICHVSLGDAYFHDTNLGWFDENRPMKFERCDLNGAKITDCNLSNCEMESCNINNMKIDGISVEEMIKVYKKYRG